MKYRKRLKKIETVQAWALEVIFKDISSPPNMFIIIQIPNRNFVKKNDRTNSKNYMKICGAKKAETLGFFAVIVAVCVCVCVREREREREREGCMLYDLCKVQNQAKLTCGERKLGLLGD